MLVKELKAFSKPVRHFEQYVIDGIKVSLCSRPRMIIGQKKPRKRFWIFGEKVERPLYARGRAYQLELVCDPPQGLPAAFSRMEAAAQKCGLPLTQHFLATPADMTIFTKEWEMCSVLGYGDDAKPETTTTAVVTILGIIRSDAVRDDFMRYASATAEPHRVNSGYQTISFLTGEAVINGYPHLHFLQTWPEFDEDQVLAFCTNILATAKRHVGSLGVWGQGTQWDKFRTHSLPYLQTRGSFIGETQASGFYRTFHFAYFHSGA